MRRLMLALGVSAAMAALCSAVPVQAQNTGATTQQERMKSCNAEAKAQKLSGDARKSFMSECLKGDTATATPPKNGQGTTAASPPQSGKDTTAANPPSSGTTQPPASAKKAPSAAGPATATTLAAGQFASEGEARRHCPSDQVVWGNTDSKIYHYAGTKYYGNTKAGAYMCQRDGERAGYRAAKNETPPAGAQSSR